MHIRYFQGFVLYFQLKEGVVWNSNKKQEERIQEMEQVISLLEEENSLQRQLIEKLEKENRMLQKHADDYSAAMRQMLEDFQ